MEFEGHRIGQMYAMAGPVGRVSAMVRGKIARISSFLSPKESHEIQPKNAHQQTAEMASVEIIVALFHA